MKFEGCDKEVCHDLFRDADTPKFGMDRPWWEQVKAHVMSCYDEACGHMDPEQLTDAQRSAIALLAGVPSPIEFDIGTLTHRPVFRPCTFVVENGKWKVLHLA